MLTRFASSDSGTKAAMRSTSPANIRVMRTGVPVRGLTRATACGSRPSRPMAKPMRVMVMRSTRITDVSPATAAIDTSDDAQPSPTWSKASAIGAPGSMSR